MDNKILIGIIIIATIIVATSILAYEMMMNETSETVQLSSTASIQMPTGNNLFHKNITKSNVKGITQFSNGVTNISTFNSNGKGLESMGAMYEFASTRSNMVGDQQDTIVESNINGEKVYSYWTGNNNTHDNILITSKDKKELTKIINTIKYNTTSNNTNNTNNTTNNTHNTNNSASAKYQEIKDDEYLQGETVYKDTSTGKYYYQGQEMNYEKLADDYNREHGVGAYAKN